MRHEERFPPTKLSVGCGFRKETIAGMSRNGRDAPYADLSTYPRDLASRSTGKPTASFRG